MTRFPLGRLVLLLICAGLPATVVAPTTCRAQDFEILGPRALGMGGAHVAAVQDESAVYWNPGALALAGESLDAREATEPRKVEGSHGSLALAATPGLNSLHDVAQVVGDTVDILNGKVTDPAKIARTAQRIAKGILNEDLGADVLSNASLLFHYGYFGVGALTILDVAGVPRLTPGSPIPTSLDDIDLENVPLEVAYVGGLFVEIPVVVSYPVLDWLSVGAAAKYIYGETLANAEPLQNLDPNQYFEDVFTRTKGSSNFGLDLGLLLHDRWLALGVLARNVNGPSFDLPDGSHDLGLPGSVEIHRQVRVGLAIRPIEAFTLGADCDLIPNPTFLSEVQKRDYKAQNLSVGIEFLPIPYVALRGGFYWNLTESDLGPILTAGLGTNLGGLSIDLAGAFALGTTEIEGYTVTEELRVSAGIAYRL